MNGGFLVWFFFCVVRILTAQLRPAFAQYNASGSLIVPPLGNSPSKTVYTQNGNVFYTCVGGKWSLTGSEAVLMDAESHTEVGNVTSQVGDGTGENSFTFAILNSVGDSFESGFPVSSVSGRPLASEDPADSSNSLSLLLLEATSHLYYGAAATVSYVQRYSTSGGLAPSSDCSVDSSMSVPYSANYCLWSQDTSPASVPQSLVVQNGRPVEGFFAKGQVQYKYNGRAWEEVSKNAKLYNLPGTDPVGEYYGEGGDGWKLFQPNGWTVYARPTSISVEVEQNCIPWTLSAVTDEVSVPVMLGPFTFVLTTSTRGGIPPTTPPDSSSSPAGAISYVDYSAIYWFFTLF